MFRKIALSTVTVVATVSMLAACSNPSDQSSTATSAAGTTETSSAAAPMTSSKAGSNADEAAPIEFKDAVVRAMPEGKTMTAIFGTLVNTSDKDIALEGFTSSLDAGRYELHEVVDGQMRQIDGPIVIPAGGEFVLKPGAEHLMLMDVKEPVLAGDTVNIDLEFSDGSALPVDNIPVRSMNAGNENYSGMSHGEMNHGDMGQGADEHAGQDHAGQDHAGHDHAEHTAETTTSAQ